MSLQQMSGPKKHQGDVIYIAKMDSLMHSEIGLSVTFLSETNREFIGAQEEYYGLTPGMIGLFENCHGPIPSDDGAPGPSMSHDNN